MYMTRKRICYHPRHIRCPKCYLNPNLQTIQSRPWIPPTSEVPILQNETKNPLPAPKISSPNPINKTPHLSTKGRSKKKKQIKGRNISGEILSPVPISADFYTSSPTAPQKLDFSKITDQNIQRSGARVRKQTKKFDALLESKINFPKL